MSTSSVDSARAGVAQAKSKLLTWAEEHDAQREKARPLLGALGNAMGGALGGAVTGLAGAALSAGVSGLGGLVMGTLFGGKKRKHKAEEGEDQRSPGLLGGLAGKAMVGGALAAKGVKWALPVVGRAAWGVVRRGVSEQVKRRSGGR